MGEVIAILSGKGGTGKTSFCGAAAAALCMQGKRVLCIDCDVGLRNLDISLGMTDLGTVSFLDVSQGGYSLSQIPRHRSFETLSFLTAPMNVPVEAIDPEPFGELLRQARKEFDYILLDAPAGVDAGFRLATKFAGRVILVTGPDPAAIRDARQAADMLELMGNTHVRMVVNRVNKKMIKALKLTIDDVMDDTGLPLLGIVPEDPQVVFAAAAGLALQQHSPKSPAAAAARRIARRIQGLSAPMPYK